MCAFQPQKPVGIQEGEVAISVSLSVIFLLISPWFVSIRNNNKNLKLRSWKMISSLSHCLSYFFFSVHPAFSSYSSLPLCWHPIISLWADGWVWEWMGRLGERRGERNWGVMSERQNRVTETKIEKIFVKTLLMSGRACLLHKLQYLLFTKLLSFLTPHHNYFCLLLSKKISLLLK